MGREYRITKELQHRSGTSMIDAWGASDRQSSKVGIPSCNV